MGSNKITPIKAEKETPMSKRQQGKRSKDAKVRGRRGPDIFGAGEKIKGPKPHKLGSIIPYSMAS